MDRERKRNRKIDGIFQEVLLRDPSERASFLDSTCDGDADLRREVELLLASDEQAVDFIESPPIDVSTSILDGNGDYSLIGKFIGPYKIISQIGAGGMGDIYLARDDRLGRDVALKLLTDTLAPDEQFRARFMREARLSSSLDHPNICTIYDIGSDGDYLYIAMQYVQGETLRRVISGNPLPLERLFSIGVQMGEAIAAAHDSGIIHRDIKPENVIVRKDGLVKILDFGLAKIIAGQQAIANDAGDPDFAHFTTTPGLILGTISYMSPEQARGQPSDERSDVWGFGCVLYEMATGRPPFAGKSKADVLGALLKDSHVPVIDVNSEIPRRVSDIIDHALAKEPGQRYRSVREIADDLRSMMSGMGISERFYVSGERLATAQQTKVGSSMYALGASIAAIVAIVGFVGYFLWFGSPLQTIPPRQRLISTFPGSHTSASFSPDGQRIAFVNSVNGVPQIWTKDLADGEPVQITSGDDAAQRPRWSPQGESIVYTQYSDGKPSIWSVSFGGDPKKLIDGARNPNWSWDGSQLVFERGYDIWIADADGGDQRRVDGVPSTDLLLSDRMPAFSPDGSWIAFFQKSRGPIGDYWVVPAPGGTARQLTFDDTLGGAPAWSADGKFVIFPSQRNGTKTLWKVPAAGGEPEPILVSSGEDAQPDISRDGRRLIYTNTRNSFVVVVTDAATGQQSELYQSRSDLVDPSFSPGGDRILFFGFAESGGIHLFTVNSDGSDLRQITKGNEHNIHPRWSADGRAIYYYHQRPQSSFRRLSLQDGQVTELAQGWEWATHNHASVDPEEEHIVYTKLDRGTPVATMIYEIVSGNERAFTMLLRPHRWSHNGEFIAGSGVSSGNAAASHVLVCPTDGAACRKLTLGFDPHWSADDSTIYFKREGGVRDGAELWSIRIDGTDEKHVTDLRPMQPIGEFFDVSATGHIVWIKHQLGRPELWLLDYSN